MLDAHEPIIVDAESINNLSMRLYLNTRQLTMHNIYTCTSIPGPYAPLTVWRDGWITSGASDQRRRLLRLSSPGQTIDGPIVRDADVVDFWKRAHGKAVVVPTRQVSLVEVGGGAR